MGVTSQLLELYRVDQQLRGLTGRLNTAEAYLAEQDKLLAQIKSKHDALGSQLRQLEASAHNDESESKGIDERIEKLRDRMNSAATSKEHSALVTEISTLKADKGLIEDRALTSMQKVETMRKQVETLEAERAEREKVRAIALRDRDERSAEIKERLAELNEQRSEKVKDVPPEALKVYSARLQSGEEDVMAPLNEEDRRNLEYTCGSCFTMLPVELVSVLLKRGDVTRCPSCRVLLYIETSLKDDIATSQEKKKNGGAAVKSSSKSAKSGGKGGSKKTVPPSDS